MTTRHGTFLNLPPSSSSDLPPPLSPTAGERRKTEAIIAMAEALLQVPEVKAESTPKRPLRESASDDNQQPKPSAGSSRSNMPPLTARKLSGPETDAVIAKVQSAVQQCASPGSRLPAHDEAEDTPKTRAARLRKEMEVSAAPRT